MVRGIKRNKAMPDMLKIDLNVEVKGGGVGVREGERCWRDEEVCVGDEEVCVG
jgi:hypothetical protein